MRPFSWFWLPSFVVVVGRINNCPNRIFRPNVHIVYCTITIPVPASHSGHCSQRSVSGRLPWGLRICVHVRRTQAAQDTRICVRIAYTPLRYF
ncbi:hypothetical protein F5Y12DRAFT_732982 [Xylaria sp. FL1777]|nr:hypothetical protein F5Y12DRAFT_732982 [Xylaria sp. FL1777]